MFSMVAGDKTMSLPSYAVDPPHTQLFHSHGLRRAVQVFVMTGWYPCVKKALLARGWVHNPDRDSPYFDLKWTLHSQDIRSTHIEPWQLCNHFFKVKIQTLAAENKTNQLALCVGMC